MTNVSKQKQNKDNVNIEKIPTLRFSEFKDKWRKYYIGEIFDERSEKGFINLELLSVTLKDGVIKRNELESKDNSSKDKSNYKRVLPNDIVYNSMRMWQGASGRSDFEGIVSPAYTILIPKNLDSKFISYLFKKNTTLYQFKKYSQGLTSDTWNLKYSIISKISINIPFFEEQIKISDFFSLIDKKIELLEKTLVLYQKLKKALLQKMFI